jgi:phenylalanyl-tRNA synthetase beta chain
VLPGVVDAVSHNRRHGRRDVRVFEIGTAFTAGGERRSLAAAWTGAAGGDHWSGGRRDADFFDIAGAVEQLGRAYRVATARRADAPSYLVPGRAATIMVNGTAAGACGLLDPAVAERRGLPRADAADVFVLELSLDALAATAPPGATRVVPLPRFPAVVRDMALLVDDTLSAQTLHDTIRKAGGDYLVSVELFDRFDPKKGDGKVSLAFRLTFQAPDRTLLDQDVQDALARVHQHAAAAHGAVWR